MACFELACSRRRSHVAEEWRPGWGGAKRATCAPPKGLVRCLASDAARMDADIENGSRRSLQGHEPSAEDEDDPHPGGQTRGFGPGQTISANFVENSTVWSLPWRGPIASS